MGDGGETEERRGRRESPRCTTPTSELPFGNKDSGRRGPLGSQSPHWFAVTELRGACNSRASKGSLCLCSCECQVDGQVDAAFLQCSGKDEMGKYTCGHLGWASQYSQAGFLREGRVCLSGDSWQGLETSTSG